MGNDTPSNPSHPDQQSPNQGIFQDGQRYRTHSPCPEEQQEDKEDQNDMERHVERESGPGI